MVWWCFVCLVVKKDEMRVDKLLFCNYINYNVKTERGNKFMERAGKTLQLNASIPKDLMKQLKELAEKEERSVSNMVTVLLRKALKKGV